MSDTCIVCLGDLGENANVPNLSSPPTPLSPHLGSSTIRRPSSPSHPNDFDSRLIAHLLPCGHDLHNGCLKPWVERANSCPICRQSFNTVELSAQVGGPSTSSYTVSDRTQVADVDPSMFVDELYEEPEDRPCPVCGDDDNEELLLQCDACDAFYHTYCVGLDRVPFGHWFCDTCETQRAIESVNPISPEHTRPHAHNTTERRTRAQQRRTRNRIQASSSNWARVWQSVWDHLNLDLDFPFDEDSDVSGGLRAERASQRRDFQEWERRLRVAERQGGGNRFRDTANTLLHARARRAGSQQPDPESQEELRAWNALDKAREIEAGPSPKRKRKSTTASPSDAEPPSQSERPLKRPRTRRIAENAADISDSGSRRSSEAGPSSARGTSSTTPNGGPSLLQSMLRKIEESTTPEEQHRPVPTRLSINPSGAYSSTQPSSPGGSSPTTSNHATPRARSITPPPSTSPRPSSPLSLTSKIEPIFPPAEFSPERSPAEKLSSAFSKAEAHRQSRSILQNSSPPRSEDTSPTRANVPFSTKNDLQKMVSTALKPHYQSNTVSKEQYTDINRNISRLLYDRVGAKGFVPGTEKDDYERLAFDEVAKAVEGLQATE